MIKNPITRVRSIFAGIVLLLCGYGLYLYCRLPGETVMHTWSVSQFLMQIVSHGAVHAPWMDWMPSFIYVLAFSLLCAGMFGGRTRYRYAVPVLWMMVVSMFEAGQYFHVPVGPIVPASWAETLPVQYLDNYFRFGVFDPLDMVAGFGGMVVAILLFSFKREEVTVLTVKRQSFMWYLRNAGGLAVFVFAIACLLATSEVRHCKYVPNYLSYENLRKPVTATGPEAVTESGKIYVYGDLILFNKPNQGIHLIDNTNPAMPVNLLFIPIPGNIDIAVKDDILYADSYIDLVAIDISDVDNIHEVNRVEDVFPYDPYQNLTASYLNSCSYDENMGIVIGYD